MRSCFSLYHLLKNLLSIRYGPWVWKPISKNKFLPYNKYWTFFKYKISNEGSCWNFVPYLSLYIANLLLKISISGRKKFRTTWLNFCLKREKKDARKFDWLFVASSGLYRLIYIFLKWELKYWRLIRGRHERVPARQKILGIDQILIHADPWFSRENHRNDSCSTYARVQVWVTLCDSVVETG